MVDLPPDWAIERACEASIKEHPGAIYYRAKYARNNSGYAAINAFARYIAACEEPPVDPIEQAGRQLVADTQHNWPDSPWHMHEAAETLAGRRDYTLVVMAAIEGIRRGMELARHQRDSEQVRG